MRNTECGTPEIGEEEGSVKGCEVPAKRKIGME
jgi:hypothetical protein